MLAITERKGRAGAVINAYREPGAKRRQLSFPTREAAESFVALADAEGIPAAMDAYDGARRVHRSFGSSFPTLDELAVEYVGTRESESTRRVYDGHRRYMERVGAPMRDVPVDRVTADDLSDYIERLRSYVGPRGTRLSQQTIYLAWAFVVRVLDRAERQALIRRNPAGMIENPPRQNRKHRAQDDSAITVVNRDQFEAIVKRLHTDGQRAFYRLLFASGLRVGEAEALTWGQIREVEGAAEPTAELLIDRSTTSTENGWTVGPTKSKRSRKVYVKLSVIEEIAEVVGKGDAGDRLFPWTRSTLSNAWVRARDLAAAAGEAPAGIRVHDLRHSRITYLLSNNARPVLVSRQAGHASVAFTLDRYASALPDDAAALASL